MKTKPLSAGSWLAALTLLAAAVSAPAQTVWSNALSFDGINDYVSATIPRLASNYTVSAWVFLRAGGEYWGRRIGVLSATSCYSSAEVLIHNLSDSSAPQYLHLGRCGGFDGTNSTATVPTNQWVHVAVTVSSNKQVSYFINGAAAGSWNASTFHVEIGPNITLADNSIRRFNGQLDDVQIWSVARTPAQIADSMIHPLTGGESNLVAYWRFDEGSGTIAYDATTNHFNGTLINGPVWIISGVGAPHHYSWSTIPSPQTAGMPFPVTVTARDQFENVCTNFAGTVALSGGVRWLTTNTILGSAVPTIGAPTTEGFTVGYAFTPNTNLTVTHVRHFFGSKVSIWTDGGVLLAAQAVASVPGNWLETALAAPLQLTNGVRYRVGVYLTNTVAAARDDMAGVFPYGTIDASCLIPGDAFPTSGDSARWWLVDLRYTVEGHVAVPVTPSNSQAFTNGVWSGELTVLQAATNMELVANDGSGSRGLSNPFDVEPSLVPVLDHFSWSAIASPQTAETPFPVTVTARDQFDNVYTNFGGTVALSGGIGWSTTNCILGSAVPDAIGSLGGGITAGYAFTPNTDLTVTHVRHYFGSKVSIWTDGGVLLAAQAVTSVPGTWLETPLAVPLQLTNGVRYRVGVYFTDVCAAGTNMSGVFPYGTIDVNYLGLGDAFPTNSDAFPARWWFVDLRYTVEGYEAVPVSPTNSLDFTNGVWSGDLMVLQPATNLVLMATHSNGSRGISNPFDVRGLDHFAWDTIASPQTAEMSFPVTVTARDQFDNVYTNFAGTVALSGGIGGLTTNSILGSPIPDAAGSLGGSYTVGYAFTPNMNLTVTHVRHYFGSKVSIWTEGGALLAAQAVTSEPGTWLETALAAPLQLTNGVRYRVGVYFTDVCAVGTNMAGVFPYGTIDASYMGAGDAFPTTGSDPYRWWFVDLRYTVEVHMAVPVSPTNSLDFTNGVWSGDLTVLQPATNMVLLATDGTGKRGSSNPFDVLFSPPAPVFSGCAVAAPGQFRLHATGTADLTYTLQTSSNLVDWTDYTAVTAGTNGLLEFLETDVSTQSARFYRLRWP